MLENAVCPFKMYRHDASQVSTKKRDLAIFWWDRQYFCLFIKQKAGWLVGMLYIPLHFKEKIFSLVSTAYDNTAFIVTVTRMFMGML